MVKFGFLARFETKPGKEVAFENFLKDALSFAEEETGMVAWYAFRIGFSTFGVFDTFNSEMDCLAHLSAKIVSALSEKEGELLASPPVIEKICLVAVKENNLTNKTSSRENFVQ
jgi:quinol monooxygenase YgiN